MYPQSSHKGFTLIEIMISLPIIFMIALIILNTDLLFFNTNRYIRTETASQEFKLQVEQFLKDENNCKAFLRGNNNFVRDGLSLTGKNSLYKASLKGGIPLTNLGEIERIADPYGDDHGQGKKLFELSHNIYFVGSPFRKEGTPLQIQHEDENKKILPGVISGYLNLQINTMKRTKTDTDFQYLTSNEIHDLYIPFYIYVDYSSSDFLISCTSDPNPIQYDMAFCHQLGGHYGGKSGCLFKQNHVCDLNNPFATNCIKNKAFVEYTGTDYDYVNLPQIFTYKFLHSYPETVATGSSPERKVSNLVFP